MRPSTTMELYRLKKKNSTFKIPYLAHIYTYHTSVVSKSSVRQTHEGFKDLKVVDEILNQILYNKDDFYNTFFVLGGLNSIVSNNDEDPKHVVVTKIVDIKSSEVWKSGISHRYVDALDQNIRNPLTPRWITTTVGNVKGIA